jgi:DNA repair exonuclease SbcCD ATPase subunit
VLSSSKSDSKQESRFAARIDVLSERVDTLAATVATTASAMAKKDGEIAALRRDLQARDETLQALSAQARVASETPAGNPPADVNELRSLRNAIAALTKERAQGGSGAEFEDLAAKVDTLGQRLEAISTTVAASAQRSAAPSPETQRLGLLEAELAEVKGKLDRSSAESERPSEELRAMLTTLRSQVEALGGIRSGVTEDRLNERLAETHDAVEQLGQRIDVLAEHVESASSSLGEKERELSVLHRNFTESSNRIESIVEDIREALTAFPEPDSTTLADLAAHIDRVEVAAREAAETRDRTAAELPRRIDSLEQRIATVATEVARAKTLWPVALRSLEARLDDAVHARRHEVTGGDDEHQAPDAPAGGPDDDLLAGLRDSLQAMETVAAEMARASDTLDLEEDGPSISDGQDGQDEPHAAPVVAAGATIVPLRTGDP